MRTDPSVSRRLLRFGVAGIIGSALTLAGAGQALAAPFTAGNLVVYRVGDGSAAVTNAAVAVSIEEYTPTGTFVQRITLPTTANTTGTGNRALTASGTATAEGLLSRSADGSSIVFGGYNASIGTTGVATSASATVNRVIGVVDASGNVDTTTALDTFSGGGIRSAASPDGTTLYAAGSNTGVVYAPKGSTTPTVVSSTITNLRQIAVFPLPGAASGNQLFFSTAAGTRGVYQVGTGTPTTTGQTSTIYAASSTTSAYNSFVFLDLNAAVPGPDTLYIADETTSAAGVGIQKFSLVNGSFVANGQVATGAVRGLTGSVNGTTVTLFGTTALTSTTAANAIVSVTDSTGYNATPTSTAPTSLVTAAANTIFRGITFAPAVSNAPATTGAIISEFRQRGLASTEDEYVELANTTNAALNISGWTLSYTGGGTPQTFTVPAGVTIPALGHYLLGGLGYNGGALSSIAAANNFLTAGIDDGSTLTLANAAGAAQDTVTFGSGLTAPTTAGQYAFVRQPNLTTSLPVTTANAFTFVAPNAGTYGSVTAALGAPGPENLASPRALLPLKVTLLDPAAAQSVSPNRVRVGAGASGTLSIRRLVTNNTGAAVTQLRFRIVNLSTLNSAGYSNSAQADFRSVASGFSTQSVATSSGNVTVYGTTPDTSIAQSLGGGINSTTLETASGVVTLSAPLGAGATRAYDFTFNVARPGNFTILILFEELNGTTSSVATAKAAAPSAAKPAPSKFVAR